MGELVTPSGPKPSSLGTADSAEAGDLLISNLVVTYTSNEASDYVCVGRDGWGVTLDVEPSLFKIIKKVSQGKAILDEIRKALAAFSVEGLIEHFVSKVSEFAQAVTTTPVLPELTGLAAACYIIEKLYSSGLLALGIIHQASIRELPRWMQLMEETKRHESITVE
jgi:hypothetical protein